MATKTTRKPATKQTEPEPEANGTRDYAVYADKPISATMRTFADWLIDVTGIELPNQRAEDNFRKGVALGGTLRMDFQRSDFWRDHPDNPRSENYAGKEDTEEKPAKAKATAKPATRRGRKPVEPEPEPEDIEDETDIEDEDAEPEDIEDEVEDTEDTEPEPEPAKPAARRGRRPAAGKATASKPATGRSRRPGRQAAQAQTEEVEAPY